MAQGALPTMPLGMTTDKSAQQEYMEAVEKLLTSLETRANAGPNLWNVAAAFAAPTRTGGFGESLGNVAATVGKDLAAQREQQIPLAKLKAELAANKYDIQSTGEALRMLGGAPMGGAPAAGTPMGQPAESTGAPEAGMPMQGGLPSAQQTRAPGPSFDLTPEQYAAIAVKSPKVGEIAKNAATMQAEKIKNAIEAFKAGKDIASLVAQYGTAILRYLPEDPTRGKIMPSTLQGAQPQPQAGTKFDSATQIGQTSTPTPPGAKDTAAPPVKPSAERELPLATQQDIAKRRIESEDKKWDEQIDQIYSWGPQETAKSERELKELATIATTYPGLFGQLKRQGILYAIADAANEGIQAGRLGSVSLPVKKLMQGITVPDEQRPALERATQILANQFFENARANKSVLGPQISNSDTALLKSPLVSDESTAKAITLWSAQNVVLAKQREALYRSLFEWKDINGSQTAPREFFNSERYRSTISKYDQLFRGVQDRFGPVKQYKPIEGAQQ